jgi:N,N'-diacetyl-8-epilegionaminate cytidylyltransferase
MDEKCCCEFHIPQFLYKARDVNPNTVAFIFARGGSKGIFRKNIRELLGKPLIAYSIEAAQESDLISRVIVSTDDAEIADIARAYGAEVPFVRPADLSGDDAPERAAWQHAIKTLRSMEGERSVDVFVCVSTTAPLRAVADLDVCIKAFLQEEVDIVITVSTAVRSPYYNMVELDEGGMAQLAIPPQRMLHARQKAPQIYDMTTVAYVARPDHVLESDYIFDGRVMAVVIPKERSLDIDTELDWQFAEFLLARRDEGEI